MLGKQYNDEHQKNKELISVTLETSNFEISGKQIKDLQL